jgi:hypothetical protein
LHAVEHIHAGGRDAGGSFIPRHSVASEGHGDRARGRLDFKTNTYKFGVDWSPIEDLRRAISSVANTASGWVSTI